MREDLAELHIELSNLETKIDSVPADIIDPVLTQKEIENKERLILKTTANRTNTKIQLDKDETKYAKISEFLKTFEVDSYRHKERIVDEKSNELSVLIKEMSTFSDERIRNLRKHDLLADVPCGDKYLSLIHI